MFPAAVRREKLFLFCIPALILVVGCGMSLLSASAVAEVLRFLTAWTCLSIPLAVLVGHCALGDD